MLSQEILEPLACEILKTGALALRDVPANITNDQVKNLPVEQQPFMYASGNWGPGYVMVKGLVSHKALVKKMGKYLAKEVSDKWPEGVDFVAGNVTGGMIPGWLVSEGLEAWLRKEVPFVYIRELRKAGGHKELITGIQNNPNIHSDADGLDMEELVNFAQTIINGAVCLREAGFRCNKGACFLYYNNPEANKQLVEAKVEMAYLLTLEQLIDVAAKYGTHQASLLEDYRRFLHNPLQWQAQRGLTRVEKGGTL